jgi:aldehyde dehydrogenase (NAD+)
VTEPDDGQGRIVETRHLPIGVVGGIAPWNFPVLLGMFKIAPALLAGNTLVLKPSPFTPLATLKLGELARDILPPGVLNIVSGGDALGPWMTSHPGIDKISFTGSTQTGRRVMESAAASLKRVTLELGGNDAAIILPDVDVEAIAEQLFWSAFRNSGQVCIATKRMYVHSAVYRQVRDALVAYARTIQVGDGAVVGARLGPINNRPQYDRVRELIADTKACGYSFAVGGEELAGQGYFIPVTIVDNPPEQARIVQEEQFGPVLPLLKFDDIDDAIARANASSFGLGGSVWSGDEGAALSVAARLNTGNVWINGLQYLTPLASFGGQKQSGIGVEGGTDGLLEFTVPRTLVRNQS